MGRRVAVAAIGQDQPGILAALVAALGDAVLTGSTMTRLEGEFAVLLTAVVDRPAPDVAAGLAPVGELYALHVSVRDLGEPPPEPGVDYTLVIHGADRPSVVADIAGAAARYGINVVAMSRDGSALLLEARVPGPRAAIAFAEELAALSATLEADCRFEPLERRRA